MPGRDERYEGPAAILARAAAADDPVVRDLAEAERDLIRRYAERRAALSPQARASLAATIATGIRPKLAASYAHLDDDALLQFLAEHALA